MTMDYISKNYKRTHLYSDMHGYHFHHGQPMNEPKGYSVRKGRIGVELEVEFTDYRKCSEFKRAKSNWFYLERDGSIGGYNTEGVEIITIPLRPQDAKSPEFWREGLTKHISDHAISWDTCGRCGLHVHIGNERLGGHPLTIQENQAKLIYFHEHFLKYHPITKAVYGRDRSYHEQDGRTLAGREAMAQREYLKKSRATQEQLKEATIRENQYCRYHAINITNSKTTEFRLGKGSLSSTRIAAVVEYADLQCEYAKRLNWGQMSVEDFIQFLEIRASENLMAYVNRGLAVAE
jgi:hypothetical protein